MVKVHMFKEKYITEKEINDSIDLLHEDYRKLDTNIYVLGTIIPFIKLYLFGKIEMRFLDFIEMVYMSVLSQCYGCEANGSVFLFSWNAKESTIEQRKIAIISTVFHEIRHAYQYEYGNIGKLRNYDYDDYINGGEGYESQYIERDANKFSMRMLNKHMKELHKILDLDFIYVARWCDIIEIKNVGKRFFDKE